MVEVKYLTINNCSWTLALIEFWLAAEGAEPNRPYRELLEKLRRLTMCRTRSSGYQIQQHNTSRNCLEITRLVCGFSLLTAPCVLRIWCLIQRNQNATWRYTRFSDKKGIRISPSINTAKHLQLVSAAAMERLTRNEPVDSLVADEPIIKTVATILEGEIPSLNMCPEKEILSGLTRDVERSLMMTEMPCLLVTSSLATFALPS